jgi:hypothetical protein
MNRTTKMAVAVACLAAAAAPAVANADKPANPGSQGKHKPATHTKAPAGDTNSPSQGRSMRCRKPTVSKAFVVSGTFTSWTAVKDAPADPASTYSGTITLTVKRANHHAQGATSPIAFSHARVRFHGATATAPVAGDNVRLIGKIVLAKRSCSTQAGSATPAPGTVTIRKITISQAAGG